MVSHWTPPVLVHMIGHGLKEASAVPAVQAMTDYTVGGLKLRIPRSKVAPPLHDALHLEIVTHLFY